MNWTQYKKMLDVKIADTHYNLEYADKKYREAKAQHESALRERDSFEKALENLMERVGESDI
jgi:hypothetical protein